MAKTNKATSNPTGAQTGGGPRSFNAAESGVGGKVEYRVMERSFIDRAIVEPNETVWIDKNVKPGNHLQRVTGGASPPPVDEAPPAEEAPPDGETLPPEEDAADLVT